MNRRTMIRSATGLLLAAGAGEVLLPERTVFALDRTMLGPRTFGVDGFVVMVDPKAPDYRCDFEFILDGRRYPVTGPADVRRIVEFERALRIGGNQ